MALFYVIVLSFLSLCAQALPHLFEGVDRPGALLLDIDLTGAPRQGSSSSNDASSSKTRSVNPRLVLPVDEVIDEDLVTLPVVKPASGKPHTTPRGLPVEDPKNIGALITLPVIHSKRQAVYGRDLEIDLAKRADVAYYAQMTVGNPPQEVYVQLDTGSFELWVNPDCAAVRPSDRQFCEATGAYDASASSTSRDLRRTTSLQYGIGSADISYFVDDVSFVGGPALSRVQFGIATRTTDQFAGILGLGHGQNYSTPYLNIMDQLVAQGAIRTKAYSLALGSKAEEQGLLVLGGIDTLKYTGRLTPLPVIPADESPDGVARFWVALESISFTPPSGRSTAYPNSALPVFLDSGATLNFLPRPLADAIAASFGSAGADARGFYPVSCSLLAVPGTVDFAFAAGVTVRVPYGEMIREIARMDGTSTCILGIVPSRDFVLLGDTFLRSAYAVFDLEKDVVYMAQYANCGSRTMELMSTEHIGAIVGLCPSNSGSLEGEQGAGGNGTAAPAEGDGGDEQQFEDGDDESASSSSATGRPRPGHGVLGGPALWWSTCTSMAVGFLVGASYIG